jgi:PAS domain S-box-containing protein
MASIYAARWHFNAYALVLFLCALVTIGVAGYAWRQRALIGAGPALTLLGTTVWSTGYGIAVGVHSLEGRIFWAKIQHVGIALTSVAMAVSVLTYTGHEKWLTRRNLALLAAVPFVGLLLAWTNEAHGLIWADVKLRIVGSLALLDITYGPYFWFYFAYNYLVLLAGAAVFLQATLRAPPLQRRQAIVLLLGTLCPGVALLLYLTGLSPWPDLDLAPLGYSLCGLILAWGLFRRRLFDLVPVARDKVIENMSDGVLVLDVQGRVVDVNPAMLQVLGQPAKKIIGRPITQFLMGQPDLVERYRQVPEVQEQITIGQGETQRIFDLRISPLYGRRQDLTGRVVVLRDATERQRAAAERERLIAELNAFAHTVAHDLKDPLSTMIGYSELLEGTDATLPDLDRRKCLRTIVWSGRKMGIIIDELLLLASVRREEVPIQPLDTERIVHEALQRLAPMIEEHQADVVQGDHWPVALGYDPWVEEVWVNYISNAIRHGGQPPRVEVGADLLEEGLVRFWVRDNGPGISAEEQDRLFTPFSRIGQIGREGKGLGLSIVRRIAEKLGGQVGLESSAGQGSLFYFTLPAAPGPEGKAPLPDTRDP